MGKAVVKAGGFVAQPMMTAKDCGPTAVYQMCLWDGIKETRGDIQRKWKWRNLNKQDTPHDHTRIWRKLGRHVEWMRLDKESMFEIVAVRGIPLVQLVRMGFLSYHWQVVYGYDFGSGSWIVSTGFGGTQSIPKEEMNEIFFRGTVTSGMLGITALGYTIRQLDITVKRKGSLWRFAQSVLSRALWLLPFIG